MSENSQRSNKNVHWKFPRVTWSEITVCSNQMKPLVSCGVAVTELIISIDWLTSCLETLTELSLTNSFFVRLTTDQVTHSLYKQHQIKASLSISQWGASYRGGACVSPPDWIIDKDTSILWWLKRLFCHLFCKSVWGSSSVHKSDYYGNDKQCRMKCDVEDGEFRRERKS